MINNKMSVNELRREYVFNQWVIVAKERGKRPHEFKKGQAVKKPVNGCVFCPGNEDMTPPEISRIEENGKWLIRTIYNKFAATTNVNRRFHENFLTKYSAYGKHEVIIETPEHNRALGDLSVEHIAKLVDVYAERIKENEKDPRIKYVLVFKNHGSEAGTSLAHSHSQVIALSRVPTTVQDELAAAGRYKREKGRCVFCDIWRQEMRSSRRIYADKNIAAFAPFASRFSFEAWIVPKRHVRSLVDMTALERFSLAGALKKIIDGLNRSLNYPPYNFYLHVAPKGHDAHFHLELCPRVSKWAGFELGTGYVINTMPAETAAQHYRQVLKTKKTLENV